MTFHPDSLPDLRGKVFIVTGGNSGIGYSTVAHLAEHGAHVYMGVRSLEKGNAAIAGIKKTYPSAAKIDLLQMDLKDLTSIVAAAKRFLTLESALHGVVNNAGIMATPFEMTKDGYEAQWQVNYLSHWVFIHHLLPLMLQTSKTAPPGGVRVVNVSSSGHLSAPKGGIDFNDTSLQEEGGPFPRYGQSKLAQILHAKTLHQQYGPLPDRPNQDQGEIWTAAIHPGLVETNLADGVDASANMNGVLYVLRKLRMIWPADKGAGSNLFCVASAEMKPQQSGTYIDVFKRFGEPWWQSGLAKDMDLAQRLEEWTSARMKKEGWIE
ncbi:hypothetical protein PG984_015599 [Apiospora sp. TS-2023a]